MKLEPKSVHLKLVVYETKLEVGTKYVNRHHQDLEILFNSIFDIMYNMDTSTKDVTSSLALFL
jgi:hypothetical protein